MRHQLNWKYIKLSIVVIVVYMFIHTVVNMGSVVQNKQSDSCNYIGNPVLKLKVFIKIYTNYTLLWSRLNIVNHSSWMEESLRNVDISSKQQQVLSDNRFLLWYASIVVDAEVQCKNDDCVFIKWDYIESSRMRKSYITHPGSVHFFINNATWLTALVRLGWTWHSPDWIISV